MKSVNQNLTSRLPGTVLPETICERVDTRHLASVSVLITFPPLPGFATGADVDQSYTRGFAERLRHDFPRFRQEHQVQIVVNEQGVQPTTGEPILRFTDIDSKWSVSLSRETVTLESFDYLGIRDFARRLSILTEILKSAFDIDYQLRFGLRFVNELRRPDKQNYSSWSSLLNPELVGYNPEETFEGTVRSLINEVTVVRADGVVRIRRGFLEGTTVRRFSENAAAALGPFYLIDLDYSDEKSQAFRTDHLDLLLRYNAYLFRIFRWSLSEQFFAEIRK